ncbi:MAG: cyclodeaminase/cyclohydrolase family protein [Bacillota bacterium]|jgi:formiminotetrahydrofolate cyclodeaminase
MKRFDQYTLNQYLHELAGGDATPGGGSAAALIGALGAALVSMVGNLTIGRKKYAAVEAEMQQMTQSVCKLQEELLLLCSQDTEAYDLVMAAYKLPKATDEDKAARKQAIADSLRAACGVPLQIAEAAIGVLQLAEQAAKQGNVNAVSDAAVGGIAAHAALHSALLNVRINLKSLPKDDWSAQTAARVAELAEQGNQLHQAVQCLCDEKLQS